MLHLRAVLLTLSTIGVVSITANAQVPHGDHRYDGYTHRPDHDYWHRDLHTPDLVKLDEYSDRLAKIARHLHEDAHKLSQDYEHSESIEHYVDQIDRLQQHLHRLLHKSVDSGTRSHALTQHVKEDVGQVKSWLNRLYAELRHQGYDGARTSDYQAMVHMRRIIVKDAMPLVRLMESELYGYSHRVHGNHRDRWNGVPHATQVNPWTPPRAARLQSQIPVYAHHLLSRILD